MNGRHRWLTGSTCTTGGAHSRRSDGFEDERAAPVADGIDLHHWQRA
jgi:hypothetical protein